MATGKQVAEVVKEAHDQLYPNRSISEVFHGGNVGTAFLGLCVKEAAVILADAIKGLTVALTAKSQPSVTNNYYQEAPKAEKSSVKKRGGK